jgi:aspartate/methionine/tyrosine aminotransferase
MAFSQRTFWNLAENDFARSVRAARERGRTLLDLTVSNPTACGFKHHEDLLAPLAAPAAKLYVPDPFGMQPARNAVAGYYRDHRAEIDTAHLCLTTSTSEAYSYLFRLLCDPGDEVIAARPSYPLFDFIAQLDNVTLREFPLHYDPNTDLHAEASGWHMDLHALAETVTSRTRAIIVVHPNNPTGSFVSVAERDALFEFCLERNLALIVDEVFLDYALTSSPYSFAAVEQPCLTFVLSGLSKVCALPQMKCSWIAALGPDALREEALARLEVIADTFLSMNAPIQHALPVWLAQRGEMQQQVLERMRANLAALDTRLRNTNAERLTVQGGWTVILRVPRTVQDKPFAKAALDRDVLVQPGDFYGLPEGRAVLSLLTPPDVWLRGLAALPID